MNIEKLWDIVNGKLSLPNTMYAFSAKKEEISKAIEEISKKDIHDSSAYFSTGLFFTRLAYNKLIELGEIDPTKIFNLATKSFDDNQKPSFFDVGLRGNEILVYNGKEWRSF